MTEPTNPTAQAEKATSQAEEVIPVPKGYESAKRLSSGTIVAIRPFKGKDVMEIMKIISGKGGGFDPMDMLFYVIAYSVMYDGQKLSIEALREIDGFDLLELMGEFQGKM